MEQMPPRISYDPGFPTDESAFISLISSSLIHWSTRSSATSSADALAIDDAITTYHDERYVMWQELLKAHQTLTDMSVSAEGAPPMTIIPERESWWGEDKDDEYSRLPSGIINPSDQRKIYWDAFVCACVVYLTMTMPYSMGFHAEASVTRALIRYGIDLAIDCTFAIDMVLSCFTAYELPTGVLVGDPRMIRIHYLKHSFVLDFASTFSRVPEFCGENNPLIKNVRVVRVVRLSKLFKLTRLMKLKSKKTDPTEEPSILAQPGVVSAIRMFLTLFVIAHMLACIWHGLVILKQQKHEAEDDRGELTRHWVNANSLNGDTPTSRKYRVALYWAFTTMTTVGYGDIYIVNNTEKLVAMFAMIVGGACFGYIIGGVTSILENLNLSSTIHGEKMDAVKEYLYDRQYPPVLATQIKKHFKHIYATEGVFDMTPILETLPAATAIDLVCACFSELVHETPFLRRADRDFIVAIAPSLFPCAAEDGEFLFFEGSVGTHLFFINSGMVSILANADGNTNHGEDQLSQHVSSSTLILKSSDDPQLSVSSGINCGTRQVGQLLGEVAIMLTFTSPYSAYVLHKTDLHAIKKETLVDVFDTHETVRKDLLKVAYHTQQHVQECLAPSQDKSNALPLKVNTGSTPSAEDEYRSHDMHLTRTEIESISYTQTRSSDPNGARVGGNHLGSSSSRHRTGECEQKLDANQEDRVLPYIDMEPRKSSEVKALSKMAHLIKTNLATTAMVSESKEQEHTKLGVLDQFRAPHNAQIHPGFDVGNHTARRVVLLINPSDLWRKYAVIHPELPAKVFWDVLVCFLIIYSIVAITYTIAFGIEERACSLPTNGWMSILPCPSSVALGISTIFPRTGIDLCIDLCFGLDMVLSFNTAHFSEVDQTLVHSRQLVARKYASGWLSIDLASTVPIDKLVRDRVNCLSSGQANAAFRAFKMVRALRLVRLVKIQQKLKLGELSERLEDRFGVNPALLKLGKPLVVMGAVAHALTCVFFAAARTHNTSWLDRIDDESDDGEKMKREERITQYLTTMYWAFATMTTVGYGDVYPAKENAAGLVATIISQVLGTMIFAYVIGILVGIVTNLDPAERHRKAEKGYLADFLTEIRDISPTSELLLRVRRNHGYCLTMNGVFDEQGVIELLPPHVRTPSIIYVYRGTLPYLPFFSAIERQHMGAIAIILNRLKSTSYSNGQIINSARIAARELHFVVKGSVSVIYTKNPNKKDGKDGGSKVDEIYGPQTYFGDAMLLVPTGTQFRLKVRVTCSSRSCHCFTLVKDDHETMRGAYSPIVQAIDGEFDHSFIKRWLRF